LWFYRKTEWWECDAVKATLNLPDDLIREIERLAVREGRTMEDIIVDSLSRDLCVGLSEPKTSVRELKPISVGRLLQPMSSSDRMEDLLNDRGHCY